MKINSFLEKNKLLTCVLVFSVILIILGLGGLTYNYVSNSSETNLPLDKEGPLVTKNIFLLKESSFDENDKSKQIKVGYNEKNHIVKIKMETAKTEDYYKIEYKIYIDNNLVNTVDGGNGYQDQIEIMRGFDGYIYVIDSKYLAILLPQLSIATNPGYKLTFYNDKVKTGDDLQIVEKGKFLCADKDCNKIINNIEDIEFDGKTIKYWYQDCEQKSNVKYEVIFDGETINKKQIAKANNMYKKGVIGC